MGPTGSRNRGKSQTKRSKPKSGTLSKLMRLSITLLIVALMAVTSVAELAFADKGGQPNENSDARGNRAASTSDSASVGESGQTCDGDPTGKSDTGHGANSSGPYDHNCTTDDDGNPTPSNNGEGDGQATGRPCEGCVGAADDQNPGINNGKGQMPGGTDRNNGYECDGNKGIGKGNPAHTSCAVRPTAPPQTNEQPPSPPSPPSGPSPAPVAVLGVSFTRAPGETAVAAAAAEQLPVTGGHSIFMLLFAISIVGAGMVFNMRMEGRHSLAG